jgi:hypothetical protein
VILTKFVKIYFKKYHVNLFNCDFVLFPFFLYKGMPGMGEVGPPQRWYSRKGEGASIKEGKDACLDGLQCCAGDASGGAVPTPIPWPLFLSWN